MQRPDIPSLETERLILRAPTAADLDAWTTRIFADPAVTRYIPSSTPDPHERAAKMLAFVNALWERRGYGEWLLFDKTNQELIGHCGLLDIAATGEVEIDYALATPYWGKRLALEAAVATLRYGFEAAALAQVIGLAVPENSASRRVLERAGFIYQRDAEYFGHLLAYHTLKREDFQPSPGVYRLHKGAS